MAMADEATPLMQPQLRIPTQQTRPRDPSSLTTDSDIAPSNQDPIVRKRNVTDVTDSSTGSRGPQEQRCSVFLEREEIEKCERNDEATAPSIPDSDRGSTVAGAPNSPPPRPAVPRGGKTRVTFGAARPAKENGAAQDDPNSKKERGASFKGENPWTAAVFLLLALLSILCAASLYDTVKIFNNHLLVDDCSYYRTQSGCRCDASNYADPTRRPSCEWNTTSLACYRNMTNSDTAPEHDRDWEIHEYCRIGTGDDKTHSLRPVVDRCVEFLLSLAVACVIIVIPFIKQAPLVHGLEASHCRDTLLIFTMLVLWGLLQVASILMTAYLALERGAHAKKGVMIVRNVSIYGSMTSLQFWACYHLMLFPFFDKFRKSGRRGTSVILLVILFCSGIAACQTYQAAIVSTQGLDERALIKWINAPILLVLVPSMLHLVGKIAQRCRARSLINRKIDSGDEASSSGEQRGENETDVVAPADTTRQSDLSQGQGSSQQKLDIHALSSIPDDRPNQTAELPPTSEGNLDSTKASVASLPVTLSGVSVALAPEASDAAVTVSESNQPKLFDARVVKVPPDAQTPESSPQANDAGRASSTDGSTDVWTLLDLDLRAKDRMPSDRVSDTFLAIPPLCLIVFFILTGVQYQFNEMQDWWVIALFFLQVSICAVVITIGHIVGATKSVKMNLVARRQKKRKRLAANRRAMQRQREALAATRAKASSPPPPPGKV